MGGVVYDAMVESSHPSAATESGTDAEADAEHAAGMASNTHAGFLGRIRKKMQRVTQFWMLDHPTIPHGTSFQSLLRIDDVHVRLATADVARQQELRRRVDEYTEQLSTDKLIEDFNTALTLRNEDGSQQTVDDVEDHFPGVRRAVDTLLGLNSQIKHKHALDAPSVRVLIEVIRTLNGPLSKIDGASAGRRASAHAYSYVGGISSADVPGLTAFDISVALNNDARTIPFTLKHWNDVVMAMHAFDAITWNHLFVSITDDDGHGDAPGSSAADSVRPPANAELEWVLVIGEGDDAVQVSAPLCVSSHYSEWYKWFKRCEIRLSQLDLVVEQGLPPVPSQYEIDKLSSPDREGLQSATVAINWITVMAQTMAYHVETRAMALYILTGSETREFIAAVATSGICLEALVAEATVQISEGQSE